MEIMQDMGMTDLQFKSWLKQIIRGLESAKAENTKEETDKKIEEILRDLKENAIWQRHIFIQCHLYPPHFLLLPLPFSLILSLLFHVLES